MTKSCSEVIEYLKTQRIGVLTVEMLDGSPHGATVHFAHTDEPLVFYFETYREYRKAEPILAQRTTRATFVIGVSEDDRKTLQLDGTLELIKPEEKGLFDRIYLGKFPDKLEKSKDPKSIFFKFTPHWWRFSDWTRKEGKLIIDSNLI